MIKRIVKLSFHPDKVDDFLAVFEEQKENIRHFKGCEHLELWRSPSKEGLFFTYSIWEDEAALEVYRASDFFAGTWARTKVLFNDRPEAWSVVVEG